MKLDEIARLAGVSRTTASYVINGKARQYRVSDKTVEKVMAVVREHNYHPNAVAAGLRAGRTRRAGPDLLLQRADRLVGDEGVDVPPRPPRRWCPIRAHRWS